MDFDLDDWVFVLFDVRLRFVCILGISLDFVTVVIGFLVLVGVGDIYHLFSDVAGFLVCFASAVVLFAINLGVGSLWGCVCVVFW